MKFSLLNRKIHYWLSISVAIPVLIIIVSGLFLQTKKQFSWIQPTEQKGTSKTANLLLPKILEIAKTVPEAEIKSWEDISRVDVRPAKGLLKVTAKNQWEIQIDTETGAILQTAYRRSDIIESIHDGSFFHDYVKLGIFLPSGIILLILWLTGMYLFISPIWVRRRRRESKGQ